MDTFSPKAADLSTLSPPLDTLYTHDFFRSHECLRQVYAAFAALIDASLHPKSLLDIGCGSGMIVEYFACKGIPILGIDGSPAAQEYWMPSLRQHCLITDIRHKPKRGLLAPYECVVSIEVAEHIEKEYAETFLDWITQGKKLFMTAAPPKQPGTHHVNCQPPIYWQNKLAQRGFQYLPEETHAWKKAAAAIPDSRKCWWVPQNAMIFTKRSHAAAPLEREENAG